MPLAKKLCLEIEGKQVPLEHDAKDGLYSGKLSKSDLVISRDSIVLKGSREDGNHIFTWRAENKGGDSTEFRAGIREKGADESTYKELMLASLRKEENNVLIQAIHRGDIGKFTEKIEVDGFGWVTLENAVKALSEVKDGAETPKCTFTKERLEKIDKFLLELEEGVVLARNARKIHEQTEMLPSF